MLSVPYYKQNRYYTCGPVCMRMVLAYWGHESDEVSLSMLCGTDIFGTSATQIANAARRLGFESEYASKYRFSALIRALRKGIPPIVAIAPDSLYLHSQRIHSKHAVVVLEIKRSSVVFHDPEIGSYRTVTPAPFKEAWLRFQNEVIFIWPANQTFIKKSAS